MRILITSSGPDLNSPVDMRFARAPYFIVYDSENPENPEVIQNPFMNTPSGAGVVAAQFVVERGVQAVVSGAFGPNSSMILSSAGIQMITETGGVSVKEAIDKAISGNYPQGVPQQAAMPASYFPQYNPYGFGWGFGRGFGWGRGFGRGWAMNWGTFPIGTYPQVYNFDEKNFLKNMIDNLKSQLNYYEKRLAEIEKNIKEEK